MIVSYEACLSAPVNSILYAPGLPVTNMLPAPTEVSFTSSLWTSAALALYGRDPVVKALKVSTNVPPLAPPTVTVSTSFASYASGVVFSPSNSSSNVPPVGGPDTVTFCNSSELAPAVTNTSPLDTSTPTPTGPSKPDAKGPCDVNGPAANADALPSNSAPATTHSVTRALVNLICLVRFILSHPSIFRSWIKPTRRIGHGLPCAYRDPPAALRVNDSLRILSCRPAPADQRERVAARAELAQRQQAQAHATARAVGRSGREHDAMT